MCWLFRLSLWGWGWGWRQSWRSRELFGDGRRRSWSRGDHRWGRRLCFEPLVRGPKLLIKPLEFLGTRGPALLLHASLFLFSSPSGPFHCQGDLRGGLFPTLPPGFILIFRCCGLAGRTPTVWVVPRGPPVPHGSPVRWRWGRFWGGRSRLRLWRPRVLYPGCLGRGRLAARGRDLFPICFRLLSSR